MIEGGVFPVNSVSAYMRVNVTNRPGKKKKNWPDLLLHLSEQPDKVKSAGETFHIIEVRIIIYSCLHTKLLLKAVAGWHPDS